ncbi:MAG: hypothetical protein V1897_01445, partial [Pseudomonadota bacterium]
GGVLMVIREILGILRDAMVIVASVIAGIWGIYRFVKLRQAKKALKISLRCQLSRIDQSTLVFVEIELSCTGTIPIYGKTPSNPDCILSVFAIPSINGDTSFASNDNRLEKLIEPIQYLQVYDSYFPEKPIIFEPGVPSEVKGFALFSTHFRGPVLLIARFVDSENVLWVTHAVTDTRSEQFEEKVQTEA